MSATQQVPKPDLQQSHTFFEALTRPARGIGGVWVMSSFSDTGRPTIKHIPNGDSAVDLMVETASEWVAAKLNVYVAPVLFHLDLPKKRTKKGGLSKGSEADVIAVCGFCCDFDDERAAEYRERLPIGPSLVVETSAGRFQTFFLFDRPILTSDKASRDEVKRVLTALINGIGKKKVDPTSKDLSHVFRVPGTLNFPSSKKLREGRSAVPQLARIVS